MRNLQCGSKIATWSNSEKAVNFTKWIVREGPTILRFAQATKLDLMDDLGPSPIPSDQLPNPSAAASEILVSSAAPSPPLCSSHKLWQQFPNQFPCLPSTPQFVLQLPSRTILLKHRSDQAAALIKTLKLFPEPTDKIQTTKHCTARTPLISLASCPILLWTLVLFLGLPLHACHQCRMSFAPLPMPHLPWGAFPNLLVTCPL